MRFVLSGKKHHLNHVWGPGKDTELGRRGFELDLV